MDEIGPWAGLLKTPSDPGGNIGIGNPLFDAQCELGFSAQRETLFICALQELDFPDRGEFRIAGRFIEVTRFGADAAPGARLQLRGHPSAGLFDKCIEGMLGIHGWPPYGVTARFPNWAPWIVFEKK